MLLAAFKLNNFFFDGSEAVAGVDYLPLVCCGKRVGLVTPELAATLAHFPAVFTVSQDLVAFNPGLDR